MTPAFVEPSLLWAGDLHRPSDARMSCWMTSVTCAQPSWLHGLPWCILQPTSLHSQESVPFLLQGMKTNPQVEALVAVLSYVACSSLALVGNKVWCMQLFTPPLCMKRSLCLTRVWRVCLLFGSLCSESSSWLLDFQ